MKRVIIILSFSLLWAGCSKYNPVSPDATTVQTDNLIFTFSIPQSSYTINDTLTATTTVYNPGDTTVNLYIPCCWPITWYSVMNRFGEISFSYSAPHNLDCNCIVELSVLPHQSKKISLLNVVVPIVDINSTHKPKGSYTLTMKNGYGTFSLRFAID